MSHFSKEFLTWLDTNADHIDQESGPIADQLLEKIAENDVFKIGVPAEFNGLGGVLLTLLMCLMNWHNTL